MNEKLGPTLADMMWAMVQAEAEAKGQREAKLQVGRESLQMLLEHRFGPLSPELGQRIEACDDPERLHQAFKQALHLEKLDDLQL